MYVLNVLIPVQCKKSKTKRVESTTVYRVSPNGNHLAIVSTLCGQNEISGRVFNTFRLYSVLETWPLFQHVRFPVIVQFRRGIFSMTTTTTAGTCAQKGSSHNNITHLYNNNRHTPGDGQFIIYESTYTYIAFTSPCYTPCIKHTCVGTRPPTARSWMEFRRRRGVWTAITAAAVSQ